MNGIAGWAGSGAGLIVIGVSWVIMHFHPHFPRWSHRWLHRAAIIGMWAGGSAVALTALGHWIIGGEMWAVGTFGGVQGGTGHAIAVIAGLFLALSVLIGLIWVPAADAAWVALALPFVLALSGGHLHELLTVFPGASFAQQVSHWLGG